MDTLTHGLLGAAVGALPSRSPKWKPRAGLLAGILAAELPDLDYLLPAADPVLHTLQAHRGLTHSLLFAPLIALAAALLSKLVFRSVPFLPIYLRALLAVPLAHLLPDLWTGWGTRLFLPFSDERLALDWTMVLDPFFTAPLLLAAIIAALKKRRNLLYAGVALSTAYLIFRIGLSGYLGGELARNYPVAKKIHIFPAPFSIFIWRYITESDDNYLAGNIELFGEFEPYAQHPKNTRASIPQDLAAIPTVKEALDWARFPLATTSSTAASTTIEVADLRYHFRGQPTLKFVITIDRDQKVTEARLDRGGSAKELLERWRKPN